MGDFAVDDWESLVDKDVEEIKAATEGQDTPVQKQQPITIDLVLDADTQNSKKEKKPNKNKEDKFELEQPKDDKPKPLTAQEKRKAELLSRLNNDNLIDDLFEGLGLENKKASAAMIVLKSDKHFTDYAKTVASRFDEETTSPDLLEEFCVELLVNIYPLMVSSQLREIQEKLTILKNEKKKEPKKKKREAKKEEKKEEAAEEKEKAEKPKPYEGKKEQDIDQERDLRYVPGMDDFM